MSANELALERVDAGDAPKRIVKHGVWMRKRNRP
jgi:hypothetical protein